MRGYTLGRPLELILGSAHANAAMPRIARKNGHHTVLVFEVRVRGRDVRREDIYGAVFNAPAIPGYSLGEMQERGSAGRCRLEIWYRDGETVGRLEIPVSPSRAEAAFMAAGIEQVDTVRRCPAAIRLVRIMDTREEKRQQIMERAKNIYARIG
ncbi:MAG: hypothetical protein NXY59_08175 [Aigarchaeota archaeon]|nr:hypothetical protein [Candidatus Pelearchaeum maunauluense]